MNVSIIDDDQPEEIEIVHSSSSSSESNSRGKTFWIDQEHSEDILRDNSAESLEMASFSSDSDFLSSAAAPSHSASERRAGSSTNIPHVHDEESSDSKNGQNDARSAQHDNVIHPGDQPHQQPKPQRKPKPYANQARNQSSMDAHSKMPHSPKYNDPPGMNLNTASSGSTSLSSMISSSSEMGADYKDHEHNSNDIDGKKGSNANGSENASLNNAQLLHDNSEEMSNDDANIHSNSNRKPSLQQSNSIKSNQTSSMPYEKHSSEFSTRLVEYFVVVSSVPRMIQRRHDGDGHINNPNVHSSINSNRNQLDPKESPNISERNDEYTKVKKLYHQSNNADDSDEEKSLESIRPPPPPPPPPMPTQPPEYCVNPRRASRLESRWVHFQDGSAGNGIGDGYSKPPHHEQELGNQSHLEEGEYRQETPQLSQQQQKTTIQNEEESAKLGEDDGYDAFEDKPFTTLESLSAEINNFTETYYGHNTDTYNLSTSKSNPPPTPDDASSTLTVKPPSPVSTPTASVCSASLFSANTPTTAAEEASTPASRLKERMKRNQFFRHRSERKKSVMTNWNNAKAGSMRNMEKKLESKWKGLKMKVSGLSSASGSGSWERQDGGGSECGQQHNQEEQQREQWDEESHPQRDYDQFQQEHDEFAREVRPCGDDRSESSYSSLSESNIGEIPAKDTINIKHKTNTNTNHKLQLTLGNSTTVGSTFRPSQTPTSARKVPPPPPPMTPNSANFSNGTPASSVEGRNHCGGPSENIRMGFEYEFRDRSFNDDIDDCVLEPVITAQYPLVDHPDQPLNPMLPQFCFPHGVEYIVPSHEYKMPKVHHFVLTDSAGGKLYGTCLTVYEEFQFWGGSEQEDDSSLPSVRSEQQERARVEISINGSPKVVRPRRRSKTHTYYAPRVLCLLSTWPYLSAFRMYLTELYRMATCTTNFMKAPIERYILNICAEVPAPPPGSFEVQLSILDSTIRFWAPPADQPVAYVSLPYGILFECLDIGNVLFAWYSLACERKVLLVSGQLSLLTVCAEILCSMLFPMRWSHLYIPVLPRFLSPMLDAPMPYLCGISRENFPHAVGDISEETVVVDLDRNIITMGQNTPDLPSLPHRRKIKLEAALEQHAGEVFWQARGLTTTQVEEARESGDENKLAILFGKADAVWDEKISTLDDAFKCSPAPDSMSLLYDSAIGFTDDKKQSRWDAVQEAFLRFYVSMLKDYRKFLPPSPKEIRSSWRDFGGIDSGGRFMVEDFMRAQRPEFQPFLEELVGTQQFDDFITKRMYNAGNAPDVTFFDQSIDAKKNRSKLKLKKVETPFLHSANAHRDLKRIHAIEPNVANLPHYHVSNSAYDVRTGTFNYATWPESFDESLFGKPRPIPSIITAEFDRRSALAAMLRQKHGLSMADSLPGSTHPSPEATAFVLFFVTFSQIIGKEWVAMGAQQVAMGDNMLDEEEDKMRCQPSVSSIDEADSLGQDDPWKPKVNPPWMAGEDFQLFHSNLRPKEKNYDEVIRSDEAMNEISPNNRFTAADCANVCANCDLGKAIDPSTFIGLPWAPNAAGSVKTDPTITNYVNQFSSFDGAGPVVEELCNEVEKARAIAKAQVDLGFHTLKMMNARKVPPEAIAYKALIDACGRCGITHRASQLMEMMTQDGLAIDSEVYFSFIRAFSNADGTSIIPYQETETTSAKSSLPANSCRRFSGGDDPSVGSNSVRKEMARGINGLYTAMSSASHRRAYRKEKVEQVKSFFKQGLTKQNNLVVTDSIKIQLELSHCILEDLYPGLVIDTESDTCPKCSCVLDQDYIILGWKPCDTKDYSTSCPSCKHRFVPKFSVSTDLPSFEGSQGKGTTLYCDYLSPWVLLREIRSLISKPSAPKRGLSKPQGLYRNDSTNYQVGIEKIIDPAFREGSDINATLWWNLIVTFARFKIPFTFLLQGSYKDQQLIMPTLEDM